MITYRTAYMIEQAIDKVIRFIVWKLPRRFLYWSIIRAWANASTGEWSHVDATAVTVNQMLSRIETNSEDE